MRHEFGETLMDANKFNKKVDDIEKERKKLFNFTIAGWLMAFAMFVTALLLTFK